MRISGLSTGPSDNRRCITHNRVGGVSAALQQLLAYICKLYSANTELPAFLVLFYSAAEGSGYDLMSVAYADKLEVRVLGRDLAREVNKMIDPWYVLVS